MSPVLFALDIFQIRSHINSQAWLDCDPPIYSSHVAGMTGTHHHTQLLLVEMGGLTNFLRGMALIMILPISTSQVFRVTGMSCHAWHIVIDTFL
jgi:hypothetical protein